MSATSSSDTVNSSHSYSSSEGDENINTANTDSAAFQCYVKKQGESTGGRAGRATRDKSTIQEYARENLFRAIKYPAMEFFQITNPFTNTLAKLLEYKEGNSNEDFVQRYPKFIKPLLTKTVRNRRNTVTKSIEDVAKKFFRAGKMKPLEAILKFWEDKDTFFWVLDHFLKCVIGYENFKTHFVITNKSLWSEHVSYTDMAFLYFRIKLYYATWKEEVESETISDITEDGSGNRKKTKKQTSKKDDRVDEYNKMEDIIVQDVLDKYKDAIDNAYMVHRGEVNARHRQKREENKKKTRVDEKEELPRKKQRVDLSWLADGNVEEV